jgi:hypothetical protein
MSKAVGLSTTLLKLEQMGDSEMKRGVGLGRAVSARESCGSHSQPATRRTVTVVLFVVDQHLHVTIHRRVPKWYRKDCQNKMLGDMNKSG